MNEQAVPDGPGPYNYPNFDQHIAEGGERHAEAAFRDAMGAGEQAKDYTLLRLEDGARVELSELWRARPLVMEFGSFT
ncbi:hypothetical protein H0B56_02715 [Haloechinothrix sp. YIM 98757]|uniref:Uncharacterized protein n=2 Tax=Haloechinothrix aidingensis TaxID=2752311 RepID=A0A838A7X6_9PSEU|nr:hypothetical protein [Haloechinothrix aidingensis]